MTLRPKRKGGRRRTRHPMPLPPRDGSPAEDFMEGKAEERGAPVRFGPQAELCRSTACCVCWVIGDMKRQGFRFIEMRSDDGRAYVPDWTRLPPAPRGSSVPHHEPEGINGDDDDTMPMCVKHHTGAGTGSGFVRHILGPVRFWERLGVDWVPIRDEMRRRTKSLSEVVSDKGARTQDSAPGMLPSPSPEARRAPGEGHLSDDDVPPSRWLPPETPRTR